VALVIVLVLGTALFRFCRPRMSESGRSLRRRFWRYHLVAAAPETQGEVLDRSGTVSRGTSASDLTGPLVRREPSLLRADSDWAS